MLLHKINLYPVFICLFFILFGIQFVDNCNDIICGSVVSKCMLTQSCKCDLLNCTCCKECKDCLSTFYTECCSCVDLCPKAEKKIGDKKKQSQVEEFEGIPDLFNALTAEPELDKWTTIVVPVDLEKRLSESKPEINNYMNNNFFEDDENRIQTSSTVVNCTVVYFRQCMALNKCKEICGTMGARGCRWFHDGCCECIGSTCLKFGINESKCAACPDYKKDSSSSDRSIEDYDDMELLDSNL